MDITNKVRDEGYRRESTTADGGAAYVIVE